jgi:hypothetical protein
MTLGYRLQLPARFGGGRETRLYVSGDNLLLFTPYSGFDPEVFVRAGDGVTASPRAAWTTWPTRAPGRSSPAPASSSDARRAARRPPGRRAARDPSRTRDRALRPTCPTSSKLTRRRLALGAAVLAAATGAPGCTT